MANSGWTSVKFGNFATLQRGFDLPVNNRKAGNIPVYAANGIVGYHNVHKVEGPGVITGRSGTIGKVMFVNSNYWPLNTSLYIKNFHGNDPKFVYWFITHYRLERLADGTSVPTLNRNVVHLKRVSIPPLQEQKNIATILSTWDRAIERTRELIKAKTKLKKALMQQLLTGKRRFKEFKKPWNKKRLHDICTLSYGKSQKEVISDEGKYPIWGTGGIVGYADDFLYNKPSIIIGRKGTIDKPSYCPTPFWAIDTTFYTEIKKGIDPQWLFQRFLVIPWRRFNEASGVPSLSRETIYKIKVEVPEEEEQKRIGLVLQAMDMCPASLGNGENLR